MLRELLLGPCPGGRSLAGAAPAGASSPALHEHVNGEPGSRAAGQPGSREGLGRAAGRA